MSRPKSHLAVLKNCVPGTFAGVLLSTTVTLDDELLPGRDDGEVAEGEQHRRRW